VALRGPKDVPTHTPSGWPAEVFRYRTDNAGAEGAIIAFVKSLVTDETLSVTAAA